MTVAEPREGPGFSVAAVILTDRDGRVLTVRKAGTSAFMLPGGKIEPGETSDVTALREVREELGLALDPARLSFVGPYATDAANEPGHWLASDVYRYGEPIGAVAPQAEIDALEWLDPALPGRELAPLTRALLPVLARGPAGDRGRGSGRR